MLTLRTDGLVVSYHIGVVEALRDHGLTVRFVAGWETRGSSTFWPQGHVVHHDAIPTTWHFPPGILIRGRSDLPGPLCNFALARDGTVWMVAAGRANHAGSGSWRGLVGNSSVWGTEANNAGTGQTWPDAQVDAYVRLCAATCDYSGFTAEMVCRHAEWTTRKIDPWGPWQDGHRWELHMSHFRALVARPNTGDNDLTDEEHDMLVAIHQELFGTGAAFGQAARPPIRERIERLHVKAGLTRRIVRAVAHNLGVTQSEIDSQA